jgi:hypothetical protein
VSPQEPLFFKMGWGGAARQREPPAQKYYHSRVSEKTPREDDARWQRRDQRRRAERQRLQKHGAGLRRVYRDAVLKRLHLHKRR